MDLKKLIDNFYRVKLFGAKKPVYLPEPVVGLTEIVQNLPGTVVSVAGQHCKIKKNNFYILPIV